MTNTNAANTLYDNLAYECDLAMALVDVLLEEQACLVKMETTRLSELALSKEAMMLELEKRYLASAAKAREAGYEANMDGLAHWVDELAGFEPRLSSTYATLRNTLQQAQRLNNTNGELVAEQLAGLQDRIAILTAAAVANQAPAPSDTYGPKGGLNAGGGAGLMPRAVIR
ncbi:flagellar export chaperone FlgN [Limnobacter sp.]|uniref:flagellar export chaperone FlgN n=1 Tax=Limnobacter sp. TaxID=2003368 RepID=UPI003518A755